MSATADEDPGPEVHGGGYVDGGVRRRTLAAVAFAAVLMVVVKSGPVKSALAGVITTALGIGS